MGRGRDVGGIRPPAIARGLSPLHRIFEEVLRFAHLYKTTEASARTEEVTAKQTGLARTLKTHRRLHKVKAEAKTLA